jgi:hypothetical protein
VADEAFDLYAQLGETVTVRGTARTGAAGAFVALEGRPVYLAGVERWDRATEGHPVEATGVLRRREAPQSDVAIHDVDGGQFILDEPRWTVADET